jgi:hypothetical protein
MDQQYRAPQVVIGLETHGRITWFFFSVSSVTLWLEILGPRIE